MYFMGRRVGSKDMCLKMPLNDRLPDLAVVDGLPDPGGLDGFPDPGGLDGLPDLAVVDRLPDPGGLGGLEDLAVVDGLPDLGVVDGLPEVYSAKLQTPKPMLPYRRPYGWAAPPLPPFTGSATVGPRGRYVAI